MARGRRRLTAVMWLAGLVHALGEGTDVRAVRAGAVATTGVPVRPVGGAGRQGTTVGPDRIRHRGSRPTIPAGSARVGG
jgi:hypothetical protein